MKNKAQNSRNTPKHKLSHKNKKLLLNLLRKIKMYHQVNEHALFLQIQPAKIVYRAVRWFCKRNCVLTNITEQNAAWLAHKCQKRTLYVEKDKLKEERRRRDIQCCNRSIQIQSWRHEKNTTYLHHQVYAKTLQESSE